MAETREDRSITQGSKMYSGQSRDATFTRRRKFWNAMGITWEKTGKNRRTRFWGAGVSATLHLVLHHDGDPGVPKTLTADDPLNEVAPDVVPPHRLPPWDEAGVAATIPALLTPDDP